MAINSDVGVMLDLGKSVHDFCSLVPTMAPCPVNFVQREGDCNQDLAWAQHTKLVDARIIAGIPRRAALRTSSKPHYVSNTWTTRVWGSWRS